MVRSARVLILTVFTSLMAIAAGCARPAVFGIPGLLGRR